MEELKDATLTVEEFGLITTAQMRRALATSFEAEGPVFIGKTVALRVTLARLAAAQSALDGPRRPTAPTKPALLGRPGAQ